MDIIIPKTNRQSNYSDMKPINVTHPTHPVPLVSQIPPIVPNFVTVQGGHPIPQPIQQRFTVRATHRTNILLLPAGERNSYILSPTVMPNIAGFCDWCGRTYDQIGNLRGVSSSYDAETDRYRNVRSGPSMAGSRQPCLPSRTQDCRNPGVAWDPWCMKS